MIVAELNIIPMGVSVSVSKFLAPAVKVLEKHKVKYTITPMCTVFEVESVEKAFRIALAAHNAVIKAGFLEL